MNTSFFLTSSFIKVVQTLCCRQTIQDGAAFIHEMTEDFLLRSLPSSWCLGASVSLFAHDQSPSSKEKVDVNETTLWCTCNRAQIHTQSSTVLAERLTLYWFHQYVGKQCSKYLRHVPTLVWTCGKKLLRESWRLGPRSCGRTSRTGQKIDCRLKTLLFHIILDSSNQMKRLISCQHWCITLAPEYETWMSSEMVARLSFLAGAGQMGHQQPCGKPCGLLLLSSCKIAM